MKYFKKQDVLNYLTFAEMAAKPLPEYVAKQMGLVKEYLGSDRYYAYSDSLTVFKNGKAAEERFVASVNATLSTSVSDAEKEFLHRLVKAYGHHDAMVIVPELEHPEVTKGVQTPQGKFFEKYGVQELQDAVVLDGRLDAAQESLGGFMDSLEPGISSRYGYLVYRDESVAVDKALKEALAYHRPIAINNVVHDHIGRYINKHRYDLQLMADWNDSISYYCSTRLNTKVFFGRVKGYEDLSTITLEKDKKGFVGLIRK